MKEGIHLRLPASPYAMTPVLKEDGKLHVFCFFLHICPSSASANTTQLGTMGTPKEGPQSNQQPSKEACGPFEYITSSADVQEYYKCTQN
jgi:hypothetical protein